MSIRLPLRQEAISTGTYDFGNLAGLARKGRPIGTVVSHECLQSLFRGRTIATVEDAAQLVVEKRRVAAVVPDVAKRTQKHGIKAAQVGDGGRDLVEIDALMEKPRRIQQQGKAIGLRCDPIAQRLRPLVRGGLLQAGRTNGTDQACAERFKLSVAVQALASLAKEVQ